MQRRSFMKLCGIVVASPALISDVGVSGTLQYYKEPEIMTITAITYNEAVYDCYGAGEEGKARLSKFRQIIDSYEVKIDVYDTQGCKPGDIITVDDGQSKKEFRIVMIQPKK